MTAEGLCYERRMDAVHPQRDRAWHRVKRVSCKKMAERSARRGEGGVCGTGGNNFVADNHPVLGSSARPPGDNRCRQQDDAGVPHWMVKPRQRNRYSQHPAMPVGEAVVFGCGQGRTSSSPCAYGCRNSRTYKGPIQAGGNTRPDGRSCWKDPRRPAAPRIREAGCCGLPPMPSAPRPSCSSNCASTARRSGSRTGGSCTGTAGWYSCVRMAAGGENPGRGTGKRKGQRLGRRGLKVRQDLCRRVAFMRRSGPKLWSIPSQCTSRPSD